MHWSPTEYKELKIWQPAVLGANAPQDSSSRVSSQEWKFAEVLGIKMLDDVMLLWEMEKKLK